MLGDKATPIKFYKLILYLQTNNKQLENELKEKNTIYQSVKICQKKPQRLNLTKDLQDIYIKTTKPQ